MEKDWEYWLEHPEEWRKLNEEGVFKREYQKFLENRVFEKHTDDVYKVSRNDLAEGVPAFKLLHDCGLVKSNSAGRRLIEQGGAYVNSVRIEKDDVITMKNSMAGEFTLQVGKKREGIYRKIRRVLIF